MGIHELKVRPRTARVQKIVTLLEAKNIPLPGLNCVVQNRLARLSLFDGTKVCCIDLFHSFSHVFCFIHDIDR